MRVKDLLEFLCTVEPDLEIKLTNFSGNIVLDVEHIDHDVENIYLLSEEI